MTILSGSVDGSNIRNYTYISPMGCSVVDYFVASKTLSLSLHLNVGQSIESKHMPVEILIESNNTEVKRLDNSTKLFKIEKFQWDEEKRSTFMEHLPQTTLWREIVQRGSHGIQLIADLIDMFILLFADDVILMSDSVCGLQNQLNILYETANHLGLVVNLDDSNIVVFRNGGHIAWNKKWFYGQSLISVVNAYKYI